MKLQIKFLQDFYGLAPMQSRKFQTYKAGTVLEIDADAYGVPTNSFWCEQLRFEENKSHFEIQTPNSTTKKSK